VNLNFVSSAKTVFFEKVARAYYHNHISIAYLLYYMNRMFKGEFQSRNELRMSLIIDSE